MQINDEPRWRPAARALSRKRSLRAGIVQLLYVGGAVGLGLLITPLDIGARIPTSVTATLLAGLRGPAHLDPDRLRVVVPHGPVRRDLPVAAAAPVSATTPWCGTRWAWSSGAIVCSTSCVVVAAGDEAITVLVPVSVIVLLVLALAITRPLQLAALRSVQMSAALDQITGRHKGRNRAALHHTASMDRTADCGSTGALHSGPLARQPKFCRPIDMPQLIRLARQADAAIQLRLMSGDLVRENAVVLEIWGVGSLPDPAFPAEVRRSRHRPGLPPRRSPDRGPRVPSACFRW